MGSRCETCGYDAEDYRSAAAQKWLRRALDRRARLVFAGLAEGAELPGVGDEDALRRELERAACEADLHEAVHLVEVAARESAALVANELVGAKGHVAQVNLSDGGVPKLPVESAEVSWRGLAGDVQRDKKHHGHPWQALCLWSIEVIEALNAEGHRLAAGSAGENLTLAGLDWAAMRTGMHLSIGSVVCQITAPAVPCHNQVRWFADGRYERIDHDVHPGWSRWYAAVVRPGAVRAGDVVEVLAPVASA